MKCRTALRTAAVVLVLCLGFLAVGCKTSVSSRPGLQDPVPIYLVDYGRTSAVIIPDARGDGWIKYAYGDWNWYALRRTESWRALPAMLWPTRGALGRAESTQPRDPHAENTYQFHVERHAAADLQERLDDEFWQRRDTLIATPEVGYEFVKYGRGYWLPNNSNHATARWMSDMGLKVRGWPVWSKWDASPAEP